MNRPIIQPRPRDNAALGQRTGWPNAVRLLIAGRRGFSAHARLAAALCGDNAFLDVWRIRKAPVRPSQNPRAHDRGERSALGVCAALREFFLASRQQHLDADGFDIGRNVGHAPSLPLCHGFVGGLFAGLLRFGATRTASETFGGEGNSSSAHPMIHARTIAASVRPWEAAFAWASRLVRRVTGTTILSSLRSSSSSVSGSGPEGNRCGTARVYRVYGHGMRIDPDVLQNIPCDRPDRRIV
jgi:hypothetical protein